MKSSEDLNRLRDMRDFCLTALRITKGSSRESLEDNETLVLAVCRVVELIGEAASKVSKATRDTHSEIPWAQITGMRNRLVHAYNDVDLDQVWNAVTEDIPPLIAQLESILPPLADDVS